MDTPTPYMQGKKTAQDAQAEGIGRTYATIDLAQYVLGHRATMRQIRAFQDGYSSVFHGRS